MYHAMMTLPDGMDYWKYATDQTKNTNALELATVFNNIFHLDSVNVSAERRGNIRAIAIGMFKEEGIQHKRAPKDLELGGVYNVADDGTEQTFTFVGCFLPTSRSMLSAWSCRESISCRHPLQWCQTKRMN